MVGFQGTDIEKGGALQGVASQSVDPVAHRSLEIRRFPRPLVYLLAPFVETFRELIEVRYLWKSPLRLDNRKLVAFLGEEPHPEIDEALGATLRGLGVMQATH
jgi:hypothetical protein